MPKPYFSPKHDGAVREKIKTSALIHRLQGFALQELDPTSKKPIEMSKEQVAAATTLLRKTLPDLSNVGRTGAEGGPLVVEVVRFSGEK